MRLFRSSSKQIVIVFIEHPMSNTPDFVWGVFDNYSEAEKCVADWQDSFMSRAPRYRISLYEVNYRLKHMAPQFYDNYKVAPK